MQKPLFVLASKSPRRKELLNNIGIQAQIIAPEVDESRFLNLPPEKMVTQLALLKASDVARSFGNNTYVIGADTAVVLDGKIFGKPMDSDDARRMLCALSGKTHYVYTGYCVIDCKDGQAVSRYEKTAVKLKQLSDDEITRYINTREPMDKAGSYAIQGKGSIFVERIEGDYFNVVGLPVCALSEVLRKEFELNIL